MKIAVVGTGYVGLVAGACFAESGNDVVCVDKDAAKVRALSKGKMPIYEPGLEELVRRNRAEGRLTFTTALPKAVRDSAIVFIAVGTPQGEDGSADLQHVLGVARDVAKAMNGYKVIVDKSTVPVGTAERVREVIRRETTHPFSVVSNPEFLKQGAAIDDFMKPDRVVIGAEDDRAQGADARALRAVHAHRRADHGDGLRQRRAGQVRRQRHAGDAHLVHERGGQRVRGGRRRRRSGAPGGRRPTGASARRSCFPASATAAAAFPKDVKAMMRFAEDAEYDFRILKAVEAVNVTQKTRLFAKMKKHFGSLKGKDDRRVGPGLQAEDRRHARGAGDSADRGAAGGRGHGAGVRSRGDGRGQEASSAAASPTPTPTTTRSRAPTRLAIVTEWNEFRRPDFERMRTLMKTPVIFDGRNLFTPAQMKQNGFTYYSIGRR